MSEHRPAPLDCGNASATDGAREARLSALLMEAYPALEVSPALRQRIAGIAARPAAGAEARPAARLSRRALFRLGWALAAAVVLAGIVVPLLQPRWVAAQTLRRVRAAMEGVRSAHEVYWRVAPNGSRTKAGETWYVGGQWRLEDLQRGRIDVFAGGKLWTYDVTANTVTVRRATGPFGYNPSGFSLEAMKRDYAQWGWRTQIQLPGSAMVNGHPTRQVSIQQPGRSERELLQVDAATDLPVRSEFQRETGERWVTERVEEYQFDVPLPASLFNPRFPAAAKRLDWDAGREQWRARLARGLARRHVAGRLIVIRDLWVNANGDVFLLYTAGASPGGYSPDWRVDLTDDQGTQYRPAFGLDPYNIVTHPIHVPGSNEWWGFTFDGEKLQGKWWVPITPQRPWRPRRFTLSFHAASMNSQQAAGPGGQTAGQAGSPVRGSFGLRVERAGSSLVPPFMPYMFDLMDAGQIEREEADTRGTFYRHVQDPQQIGNYSRGARHRDDLQEALASYQQIVRMDEAQARRTGSAPHDPGVWTNIGKVLYRLDRREAARAAFERAVRESVENDWSRQEPEELLRGVNSVLAWAPDRPAPRVSGIDLQGLAHSVADYHGQVLLISLWSRFSPEFKGELLRLKGLNDRYSPDGLAILGVAVDINRGDLARYVQAQQIRWPTLCDDKQYQSEVAARFGYSWDFTRLPRTILVGRDGIVRAVDLHGAALEHAVGELVEGGNHAAGAAHY